MNGDMAENIAAQLHLSTGSVTGTVNKGRVPLPVYSPTALSPLAGDPRSIDSPHNAQIWSGLRSHWPTLIYITLGEEGGGTKGALDAAAINQPPLWVVYSAGAAGRLAFKALWLKGNRITQSAEGAEAKRGEGRWRSREREVSSETLTSLITPIA